jgi:dehydrogenase/reductase SDR family protein 7B
LKNKNNNNKSVNMAYFINKKIWITGASSGIGKALALTLAADNISLILTARNIDALNEVVKACVIQGANAQLLALDLTDEHQINTIDDDICTGIDIIIHCAGVSQRSLALETNNSVNRQLMEINYFSIIALTQKILPSMCNRMNGQVVIISSVAGKIGTPLRSGYAGAKHALQGYFDSLRAELHHKNVSITIVFPGYINTDISMKSLTADGSQYNKIDRALSHGLPLEKCSQQIIHAIAKRKEEVIVSALKEKIGVIIKRLFPQLMSKIVRNLNEIK